MKLLAVTVLGYAMVLVLVAMLAMEERAHEATKKTLEDAMTAVREASIGVAEVSEALTATQREIENWKCAP